MNFIKNTMKNLIAILVIGFFVIPANIANADFDTPVDTLGVTQIDISARSARLNGYVFIPSDPNVNPYEPDTRVWFEWGEDTDMANSTSVMQAGTESRNFDAPVLNLEVGETYYYRAVARNDLNQQVFFGDTKSFVFENNGSVTLVDDDDDDDNNNGDDQVITLSATNIDEDSAKLRGEVTNGNNVDVWFVIDDNDSTPSCNDNSIDVSVSGDYDDGDEFSRTVSGLEEGETYYFRACSDDDSGSIRSFTTDDDNGSHNNNNDVEVVTTPASGITNTSAYINGLILLEDEDDVDYWFEWGTTVSLGNRTSTQSRDDDSISASRQLTSLTRGRAYFYRLVAEVDGDRYYGDKRSFVTGGGSTTTTTTTTTNTNTTVVTSNQSDVLLETSIEASLDPVRVGDLVTYTVTYENVSSKTLKDIFLVVTLPEELNFEGSNYGNYNRSTRTVLVRIETLGSGVKGSFLIDTEVNRRAADKTLIVVPLETSYKHPEISNAYINDVQYSIVEVDRNGGQVLGASTFFLSQAGCFGGSLFSWLLLALLVILIALLARKMKKDKEYRDSQEQKLKITN